MAVLTVSDIRKWLRYEDDDASNESPLSRVLDAGQRYIENQTGHLLGQREVVETPTAFPVSQTGLITRRPGTNAPLWYELRYRPYVADSLAVTYLDGSYAEQEYDGFTVYQANGATRFIPNNGWPTATAGISLTYTAGYETVDDVPDDLLHALCVYAGMSDEDRAGSTTAGWMTLNHLLAFYTLPVLK